MYFHGELLFHSFTLCDINTVQTSRHRNGFKMLPLNQSRRKLFILLSLHLLVLVILYRVHTGRKPKTFLSWWFLAQPALLSQMMCSAPTAQNPVALQRLPLHAYLTTHQKSFLAKLSTSTLISQRSILSCFFRIRFTFIGYAMFARCD